MTRLIHLRLLRTSLRPFLTLVPWNMKTDKGLPRYEDSEESGVFILSGAKDLVPVLRKVGDEWQRYSEDYTVDGGHVCRAAGERGNAFRHHDQYRQSERRRQREVGDSEASPRGDPRKIPLSAVDPRTLQRCVPTVLEVRVARRPPTSDARDRTSPTTPTTPSRMMGG
jgi:Salmonella virulence plasmid 65kDa B protein